jgi:hypothetical protein
MVSQMTDCTSSRAFRVAGPEAFAEAGITHNDVEHLMIYDAPCSLPGASFAHLPIFGLDDLALCRGAWAGAFIAERNTAPGGRLPLNTNGGGLSYMHSGMYALRESVRQMRGSAPAQIPGGQDLGLPRRRRFVRRVRHDHHVEQGLVLQMATMDPPIDPKALSPLMYWAGLSLQACQQFEYGIKVLLVFLDEAGVAGTSLPDSIDIIEEKKHQTLGQLINLLSRQLRMSEGWSTSIQSGLDARNEIIHRFFTERLERTADPDARPDVLADLKRLRAAVLAGDQAVQEITETFCSHHGFSLRGVIDRVSDEVRANNRERPLAH